MAITRNSITLPVEVSAEIMQKTQEASAIMSLARQIPLPGRGVAIPVITGDPAAAWVAEAAAKPVSDPSLSTKIMRAYKLAVIVPFSEEFARDAQSLYDNLIARLPGALAMKFDNTVAGGTTAPGNDFDTFASCTAQSISGTGTYAGLVAADTDIATHGGVLNGFALSPQGRGVLLAATDDNKRPLFVNNAADGAIPVVLGARTLTSKGLYVAGESSNPNVVGFAGDWSQAMYGTVEGVRIDFSKDATLVSGATTINLFQQNMLAVRAEIEIGFRADTSVFNKLTA